MKTIFFDYNHREQFSKQISSILFFIELAKKYNYLLVLPKFRFLPTVRKYLSYLPENEYSYQDFSYFFDIENLKKFYPNIIEIKDIINTNFEYPLIINTTSKSSELFDLSCNCYKGYFNGYLLSFKEKILNTQNLYDLSKYKYDFLFFDDVLDQIKHSDPKFNILRNYLIYTQYFNDLTLEIINTFLPENYLAVHWRRTDFLLARRNVFGVNKSKEYLVSKCKKILHDYKINFIYLATDSNIQEEIDYLYKNLPIINNNFNNNFKNNFNNIDFMIIETLICVNSKIFYGTRTSLFSKNIISLRVNNNNNLNYFL